MGNVNVTFKTRRTVVSNVITYVLPCDDTLILHHNRDDGSQKLHTTASTQFRTLLMVYVKISAGAVPLHRQALGARGK